MSAPKTDVEKQTRQHRTPLVGMAAVVIFALVLLVGLYVWLSAASDGPEGAEDQVRPGVGTDAEATESVGADPAGNTTGQETGETSGN